MERDAELDRNIPERVAALNTARGWPWQVPGVVSVALDDEGRAASFLATEDGVVCLGPVERQL